MINTGDSRPRSDGGWVETNPRLRFYDLKKFEIAGGARMGVCAVKESAHKHMRER